MVPLISAGRPGTLLSATVRCHLLHTAPANLCRYLVSLYNTPHLRGGSFPGLRFGGCRGMGCYLWTPWAVPTVLAMPPPFKKNRATWRYSLPSFRQAAIPNAQRKFSLPTSLLIPSYQGSYIRLLVGIGEHADEACHQIMQLSSLIISELTFSSHRNLNGHLCEL